LEGLLDEEALTYRCVSIARFRWVGLFPIAASHAFASSVAINALDEYALSPTTCAPAMPANISGASFISGVRPGESARRTGLP
jgi:hypothetical protein